MGNMNEWEDVSRFVKEKIENARHEANLKAVDALETILAENDIVMVKRLARQYINEFKEGTE